MSSLSNEHVEVDAVARVGDCMRRQEEGQSFGFVKHRDLQSFSLVVVTEDNKGQ